LRASLGAVVLSGGRTGAQVPPPAPTTLPPTSLRTVPVPKPDLAGFVRDEAAAVALGKALFWDMQLGSDGIQTCGSCHFHGGADNRLKNQVNPGTLHAATTFEVAKPNATLTAANFPLHKLANVEDRLSKVLFDADDVGPRNPNARVLQVQADGSVLPVSVAIFPASLASLAAAVPASNFALACTGRTLNKFGKKMLSLTPLAKQWVDPTDSVLGPLAMSRRTPGARGLTQSYVTLVQTAFDPKWWNSDKVVTFPGGV